MFKLRWKQALVVIVAAAGLAGWLGVGAYQSLHLGTAAPLCHGSGSGGVIKPGEAPSSQSTVAGGPGCGRSSASPPLAPSAGSASAGS
jgi:hypothetical protein